MQFFRYHLLQKARWCLDQHKVSKPKNLLLHWDLCLSERIIYISGQQIFFVKSQIANITGSIDHTVPGAATQLCHCSCKSNYRQYVNK